MKKSGIYQWKNLTTEELYVGSSVDLGSRKRQHLHALRKNKHHSQYFQRSYNIHGEDNFQFSILEIVEDITLLPEREQHYIDKLKPKYNSALFAEKPPMLGRKHTQETKDKILKTKEERGGFKHTQQTIERMLKTKEENGTFKRSEETKQKISKGNKGKKRTEEQKQALSAALKGKPGAMLGKKLTPEQVEKLKNREITPEHRTNLSKAWDRRRVESPTKPETREKMSKSISEARSKPEVKENYKKAIENRPIITCPHCLYESQNKGNMIKSHFDNCKLNPSFDQEAFDRKKEEISKKLKEAKKNRPTRICPHCNVESQNSGWMTQNHFDNCKVVNPRKKKRGEETKLKMKEAWQRRRGE